MVRRRLSRICRDKGIDLPVSLLRRIQEASSKLAEEGAPAFYAERAYSQKEALEASAAARLVFEALTAFIQSDEDDSEDMNSGQPPSTA